MSENIKSAIQKIKTLRKELQSDLSEIPNLVIRTDHVLETLANGIAHTIGENPYVESTTFKPTPITHMLGEDVTIWKDVEIKSIVPNKSDKDSLKKEANEAYETFIERDNKVILESVDDIVIRAVAKKAGLDVTSTLPEIITIDFIDDIKQAIIAKESVAVAKASESESKPAPTKKNNRR
ncbi:MAG: hypothetical protein E6Q36_10115 [Chryseobacterium sp.]|nr:MAG: hypothetical protein E6Q36_10115 [Chryseobacterium sp.]